MAAWPGAGLCIASGFTHRYDKSWRGRRRRKKKRMMKRQEKEESTGPHQEEEEEEPPSLSLRVFAPLLKCASILELVAFSNPAEGLARRP